MINRRCFLKSSLITGAALAVPSPLISPKVWSALAEPLLDVAAGEVLITILHTNDTHSQIDPVSESDKTSGSARDRKSTRLNSSHDQISYAVFCLKKKKKNKMTIETKTDSNRNKCMEQKQAT